MNSSEPQIDLQIRNFGPIAEANIALRPLTVFVGPSNSGKSYLAILLYALHMLFNDRSYEIFGHRRADTPFLVSRFVDFSFQRQLVDKAISPVVNWIREHGDRNPDPETVEEEPPPLPNEVQHVLQQLLVGDSRAKAELFADLVMTCFAEVENPGQLVRGSLRQSEITIRHAATLDSGRSSDTTHLSFHLAKSGPTFRGNIGATPKLPLRTQPLPEFIKMAAPAFLAHDTIEATDNDRSTVDSLVTWTFQNLADATLPGLVGPLASYAFLLPADRTGIMSAHSFVLGTLAAASRYAGTTEPISTPRLSGVHSDFMQQLIRKPPDSSGQSRRSLDSIASGIEETVLGGTMLYDRTDVGYPAFMYKPAQYKNTVPLGRASSMVSELAPLLYFIKHIVEVGDTVIIEEPESHLHPIAQVELAIWLARLVKTGVRVVLTTHSDWILDQLANLVAMSDLPHDKRSDLEGADAALTREQFGAWLFQPERRPKGTVVREISVDIEGGGLSSNFEPVAEGVYDSWATIGNRISNLAMK